MNTKTSIIKTLAITGVISCCSVNINQAAVVMHIFEGDGGLNIQFSGDLAASGAFNAIGGSASTTGYLDFDGFNGTTGWVGFWQSTTDALPTTMYIPAVSGTVLSNISTGFGDPISTPGAWSLMSGTTWLDDFNGSSRVFSTGPYSPGDTFDAHLFLAGGSFAASSLIPGSSFVRTIDFASNDGGGIETFTVTVAAIPEPSSAILLGLGALGLVVRRKRTA